MQAAKYRYLREQTRNSIRQQRAGSAHEERDEQFQFRRGFCRTGRSRSSRYVSWKKRLFDLFYDWNNNVM